MALLKKLWYDPVGSKVLAAGIVAVLAALLTYILELWPVFASFLITTYSFLRASTPVYNWLIGLVIVLIGLALRGFVAGHRKGGKGTLIIDYTSDEFFGVCWRWRIDEGMPHGIGHLHSLCPKCRYQILPRETMELRVSQWIVNFECQDCGYKGETQAGMWREVEQRVILKIQRNLRERLNL
ncbi:MAG: hypothetical protein KJZ84_14475 [Bryobacteraceae bacterium]|nr:hypothetical protein [Bryobacteraceae bacterium]